MPKRDRETALIRGWCSVHGSRSARVTERLKVEINGGAINAYDASMTFSRRSQSRSTAVVGRFEGRVRVGVVVNADLGNISVSRVLEGDVLMTYLCIGDKPRTC